MTTHSSLHNNNILVYNVKTLTLRKLHIEEPPGKKTDPECTLLCIIHGHLALTDQGDPYLTEKTRWMGHTCVVLKLGR